MNPCVAFSMGFCCGGSVGATYEHKKVSYMYMLTFKRNKKKQINAHLQHQKKIPNKSCKKFDAFKLAQKGNVKTYTGSHNNNMY